MPAESPPSASPAPSSSSLNRSPPSPASSRTGGSPARPTSSHPLALPRPESRQAHQRHHARRPPPPARHPTSRPAPRRPHPTRRRDPTRRARRRHRHHRPNCSQMGHHQRRQLDGLHLCSRPNWLPATAMRSSLMLNAWDGEGRHLGLTGSPLNRRSREPPGEDYRTARVGPQCPAREAALAEICVDVEAGFAEATGEIEALWFAE